MKIYPPALVIPNNPELKGLAHLIRDIVFDEQKGLSLDLLLPWQTEENQNPRFPLIVFLQGSAWTTPNRGYEIPQLARYAQEGYAVASISHRDATKGAAFPAYLIDSKQAIRFLRKNADKYGINPQRVAFFGTSSGGNTALLVGLTGDDPRFRDETDPHISDAVRLVIDCFGPADLSLMLSDKPMDEETQAILQGLVGSHDKESVLKQMSPVNEVKDGQNYPPFLLIHGDADTLVPYEQSEIMYERLLDAGARATLIRITNAPHEGNFWSHRLHGLILDFLQAHL